MTVAEALSGSGIDLSEARLLLCAASGLGRAALIAHPEAELGNSAVAAFREAVARRRAGEPIAYLLRERDFHGITLRVTPEVLIPRPETELLVEFALEHLPRGGTLADLGTGSGAIALAVGAARPDARVTGVDLSPAALGVARGNAGRLGVPLELLQGSWFEAVQGRRFDVVVSNPPYVAEGDRHLQEGDLRFEPRGALVSGPDGLNALKVIAREAALFMRPGGWIAVEHGRGQDAAVRALLRSGGLESVGSRPDLAGIARISVGQYNPE